MLVLPTSIAKSIRIPRSGYSRTLRLTASCPIYFASDKPLGAFADAHQQGAHVVDTDRDARLGATRRFPRHAHPAAAWRTVAPGVENSIGPSREQVIVARRQRGERLRAQLGAIDVASELGFERRHAIGELQRIRRGAHVQAVAEDDRLQPRNSALRRDALRKNASQLSTADEQIV